MPGTGVLWAPRMWQGGAFRTPNPSFLSPCPPKATKPTPQAQCLSKDHGVRRGASPQPESRRGCPRCRGAAASPRRAIAPEGDALLETEQTPRAPREKPLVRRFLPQGRLPTLREGGRGTPVPAAAASSCSPRAQTGCARPRGPPWGWPRSRQAWGLTGSPRGGSWERAHPPASVINLPLSLPKGEVPVSHPDISLGQWQLSTSGRELCTNRKVKFSELREWKAKSGFGEEGDERVPPHVGVNGS